MPLPCRCSALQQTPQASGWPQGAQTARSGSGTPPRGAVPAPGSWKKLCALWPGAPPCASSAQLQGAACTCCPQVPAGIHKSCFLVPLFFFFFVLGSSQAVCAEAWCPSLRMLSAAAGRSLYPLPSGNSWQPQWAASCPNAYGAGNWPCCVRCAQSCPSPALFLQLFPPSGLSLLQSTPCTFTRALPRP